MKCDENFPGGILIGVVVTLLIIAVLSNVQCGMGLHTIPKRYELREVDLEVPQLKIVEQEGMRKLLDPNGGGDR